MINTLHFEKLRGVGRVFDKAGWIVVSTMEQLALLLCLENILAAPHTKR